MSGKKRGSAGMDKGLLLQKIVERLSERLDVLEKAAQASHVEATHESSKAESKYDTRGLEAAYLAGGQARQAKEIMDSIKLYRSLPLRVFGAKDPIDVTAVVKLAVDGSSSLYFIGPKSGGLEVEQEGEEIVVITPQSPLGQQLMGKAAGQRWTARLGNSTVKYQVEQVW